MFHRVLFIVYIHDIVDKINGKIKLSANDTAIYIDVDKTENSEEILNKDLESLEKWSDQWLVKFNAGKTYAMNISLKNNPKNPRLVFKGEPLFFVKNHKHLCVCI